MPAITPVRSLEQRHSALATANVIRSKRKQLKIDLKEKRASVHSILLDPPEFVDTMKVIDLLRAVPKYGTVKANKVIGTCRMSPSKTIGGMSERQRNELVSLLRR